ncbi:MAG: cytochrome c [Acidobacteria bacterium]|nr:cytochrome c [Acidobacteriota bacterium]
MRRVSLLFMSGFIPAVAMSFAVTVHAQSRGATPAAPAVKNPVPATAASVAAGAAVYKKYCAFCHGVAAKGNGPLAPKDSNPPDLTDATWLRGSTDAAIFTLLANGVGPAFLMVPFKGKIPDQDLWHVVNYLRSLGPKTAAR